MSPFILAGAMSPVTVAGLAAQSIASGKARDALAGLVAITNEAAPA